MTCPCGNTNEFESCCGPFISGKTLPETAEQLMRSRYTAYTRADVAYIEKTTAPEERETFDPVATKKWATESKWKGLKIVATKKGTAADITGQVEFIATYEQKEGTVNHHEISLFRKDKSGQWYFVEGDARPLADKDVPQQTFPKPETVKRDKPKTGRNDPCPCGSGKKFKKCCESTAA